MSTFHIKDSTRCVLKIPASARAVEQHSKYKQGPALHLCVEFRFIDNYK